MIDTYQWRICYTNISFQIVAETIADSIAKAKVFVEVKAGVCIPDDDVSYYQDTYGSSKGHGVITSLILVDRLSEYSNDGYA